MEEVQFALKKSAVKDFAGASTTYAADARVFHIAQALEEGDGVITVGLEDRTLNGNALPEEVNPAAIVSALDGVDILHRVSSKTVDEAKQQYASRNEPGDVATETPNPPAPPRGQTTGTAGERA